MTRGYGAKHHLLGGYRSAADIAKLMRADIKAEIAAGRLPGTAANYSVRVQNYSGGRSIDIDARDLPDMWQDCTGTIPGSEDGMSARACPDVWCAGHNDPAYAAHARTHRTLSVEGRRVESVLEEIHRAYNHDGSDTQTDYFDVNYYGHASVETEEQAGWRTRERARRAAKSRL